MPLWRGNNKPPLEVVVANLKETGAFLGILYFKKGANLFGGVREILCGGRKLILEAAPAVFCYDDCGKRGSLDNKSQISKKLSKVLRDRLVSARLAGKNDVVWTIKADFKENYPKIHGFWIIGPRFEEKLSKICFMSTDLAA